MDQCLDAMVRGEVKTYTWGTLGADGSKQYNNGAIQYADGTLEFCGLTFYPDGVVIDAEGQQVGLVESACEVLTETTVVDELPAPVEPAVETPTPPPQLEEARESLPDPIEPVLEEPLPNPVPGLEEQPPAPDSDVELTQPDGAPGR
ncbi:hypothetical protein [Pseudomonas sp. Irchel 3E20]|uniref:hypothetical protein n=1 Tax=Pseudomonas sp. Irchel 3E20 TaxID=2008983 RepID=UPI000BA34258|nr:hypothetical protein [Pseudomonas sp. Irchel 3E20]